MKYNQSHKKEFRFALWSIFAVLVVSAVCQTFYMVNFDPPVIWWWYVGTYIADALMGFVAVYCLASLP